MDIEQLNKDLADEKREPVKKLARAVFKQRPPTEVQSLIFDKQKFKNSPAAIKWAKDNDFVASKVDETETSYRLRQREPRDFVSTSFRTVEIDDGVNAVIGRLRPELREPTAKSAPIKKRPRSREYLERALELARKSLPGWAYAALVRSARGHAGGTIRARMRAEEKLLLQKAAPGAMTSEELKAAYKRLTKLEADLTRKKQGGGRIKAILARVEREMVKRKLLKEEKISKGFVTGTTDGGSHAHGLARAANKTAKDGAHQHVFALPGTGQLIHTFHDGAHEHKLGSSSAMATSNDGIHSHTLVLPDGTTVETSIDGNHSHPLMLETTGFGGGHQHLLQLADGTEVRSMSVVDWIGRFGIPPRTELGDAHLLLYAVSDALHPKEVEMPTPEQAVALMSSGEEVVPAFEVLAT